MLCLAMGWLHFITEVGTLDEAPRPPLISRDDQFRTEKMR